MTRSRRTGKGEATETGPATRVLFVSRFLPEPRSSGQKIYAFNVLAQLVASGFEVEVLILAAEEAQRSVVLRIPPALRSLCPVRFMTFTRTGAWALPTRVPLSRALRVASVVFDQLPDRVRDRVRAVAPAVRRAGGDHLRWYREPSDEERAFVKRRARAFSPEAVMVNYAFLAPLFDDLPPDVTGVVLTHDVLHRNFAARPASDPDAAAAAVWTADYEAALLSRAGVVVAIQPDEAALLVDLAPKARVITVGTTFERVLSREPTARPACMFVGSDSTANRDAARWLVESVWPRVAAAVPGARLDVFGGVCAAVEGAPDSVHLNGVTAGLDDAYAGARVVLVPLRMGSGLKIKVVEAVAMGVPVVSTSIGLQGLASMVAAGCVRCADEADTFADATIDLLRDDEAHRAMGAATATYYRRFLAPEVVYAPLVEAISDAR